MNRTILDRIQNFAPKAIVASDNSYLVAGEFFEIPGIRAIITRFDLNFNVVADRFYGNGIEQRFNDIIKTSEGNFVAAGFIRKSPETIEAYMVLVNEDLALIREEQQTIGEEERFRAILGIAEETAFRLSLIHI